MPDNDHLIFDYHEHHGLVGIAHTHDDHPRHHHDANGSVIYNVAPGVIDIHNANDRRADAAPIHHGSCGGFDVRWPPTPSDRR